jgi:hypothetical protein
MKGTNPIGSNIAAQKGLCSIFSVPDFVMVPKSEAAANSADSLYLVQVDGRPKETGLF